MVPAIWQGFQDILYLTKRFCVSGRIDKTVWRRVGLVALLVPVCFIFPYVLMLVLWLAWTIYEDLKSPASANIPPPRSWIDATPEDSDWLTLFLKGCESPAEEQFLQAMVVEFDLEPNKGKLVSSNLTMQMQVQFANYRFDFVLNGWYIVEIDGATYHSSPEQVERDRIRDELSVANGYSVLRIPASIVFNNSAEAIRRVKNFAFKSTTPLMPPVAKPVPTGRPIVHYLRDLSRGIADLTQNIHDASLRQAALSEFRKAISQEQIFLGAMVNKVESKIRVMNLPPDERKFHDEMYARLTNGSNSAVEKTLAATFCWSPVVLPEPIDNLDIQLQIERECADLLEERRKRFMDLRETCSKDPMFELLFHRYMKESNFPEMDLIHPGRTGAPFG